MKHLTHLAALCACLTSFPVSAHVQEVMNEPDSVYLFFVCYRERCGA